jgi:nicotinamidase-related amidase
MQTRELVICGLATDMCVQLTAMEAFLREYRAWVPADCTAAETAQAKAAALAYVADVLRFDTAPAAAPRTKGSAPPRAAARRGSQSPS